MRVLTFQITGPLAVAVAVTLLVPLVSGCGTRQDGSVLPVLTFPRGDNAPRQTEPELPVTRATTEDGQGPPRTDSLPEEFSGDDSFPDDVNFDEP